MDTTIDICVCTYKRDSLTATLRSLMVQKVPDGVSLRIIVADNDEVPSAEALIRQISSQTGPEILYRHAPARNISIARNACLDVADAPFVAFIDDDETAPPDWLSRMLSKIESSQTTAVFGASKAIYADDTPDWIILKDYHSNYPQRRSGRVETGYTCNALLRYDDPVIRDQRFLLEKGRTGGEDTEFFFRLSRLGATFEICDDAMVFEKVGMDRANFDWLSRRRFRFGQSYGKHSAVSRRSKLTMGGLAGIKSGVSLLLALIFIASRTDRNFWLLRAVFHGGVVAGLSGWREKELY